MLGYMKADRPANCSRFPTAGTIPAISFAIDRDGSSPCAEEPSASPRSRARWYRSAQWKCSFRPCGRKTTMRPSRCPTGARRAYRPRHDESASRQEGNRRIRQAQRRHRTDGFPPKSSPSPTFRCSAPARRTTRRPGNGSRRSSGSRTRRTRKRPEGQSPLLRAAAACAAACLRHMRRLNGRKKRYPSTDSVSVSHVKVANIAT